MGSLYSILAVGDAVWMRDIAVKIPLYGTIFIAVVALLAFVVGCFKGFRRVSWGGFFWLIAGIAVVLVLSASDGVAPFAGNETGNRAKVFNAIWAIFVIAISVLASLLIYGVLGRLLRPKMKWSKKKRIETDEYGFEYEIDDDYDDPIDVRRHGRTLVKKGYGKPNALMRILGGLSSALNATLVVAFIYAIGLMLVDATGLCNGPLYDMFRVKAGRIALEMAKTYALDFATVGLIFLCTYRGCKRGFLNAVRFFFVTVGSVALVVFSFVIPFHVELSKLYYFNSLINRCTLLFDSLGALQPIVGKVLAGALMALFCIVCMVLINLLLKAICNKLETGFARVVDGTLGCVIGIIVGIVVVLALWAGLYALNHLGLFYVQEIFDVNAPVSKIFFDAVGVYLKPILSKIV